MAKKKKKQQQTVTRARSMPPRTARKFVRRSYDGAEYSRLWNDWITGTTSANAELYQILPTLRDRCRDLARNDPYANGAIRLICDNVLGEAGFTFQSKVPLLRGEGFNDAINRQIEDLFKHWSRRENCDVTGICDFTQLERLVLRTWAESGEVLIREIYEPFGYSKIPYALQVLEPDYLADDLIIRVKNTSSRVEQGVQIDRYGRREGYWIYKGHPGDRYQISEVNRYEVEFVPASEMHHLYLCDRPGQLRGVPWLAVAIKRLHFLADTEDAELVAAKLSAFVGGVIKSLEPDSFTDSVQDNEHAEEGQPGQFREFEPGMLLKLFPDEDFQSFNSNRPNQALPDFTKHILRGIAAGVGLSYSGVSNDFSDASYSSHRAEKLKEIRSTRHLQNEFKSQFHNPITRKVIEWGWLKGRLNLPQYEQYEERYQSFVWGCPSFDWIDPQKDIGAAVQAIEAGLSTYSIELGKLNRDFEEVLQERIREKKMLEDAGLIGQPEQPDQGAQLQEGLTAVRALLEGHSAEILRSIEQKNTGQIIEALVARALEPQTVEVVAECDNLSYGMQLIRPITRAAKAKNCKKGKPCGGSCVSKGYACLQGLTAAQKKLAKQAQKAMQSGGVGGSNPINPQPPTPAASPSTVGGTATADILTIRGAIETGDIDSMLPAIDRVYDAGKQQAKKDGVHFYNSIQGGNGTTDPLMTVVLAQAGFNDKPQATSKKQIDALDPKDNLIFYRNPSQSNFKKRFDQFKNADPLDYTSGRGMYCSGTYVGANYSGGKSDGVAALAAVQGYGRGTMKMAIDRNDANIMKQSDLRVKQIEFQQKLDTWMSAERSKLTPDPKKEKDLLIEFNSGKLSVTKSTAFKRRTIFAVDIKDPQTQKTDRLGKITKSSVGAPPGKPWKASNGTTYYATRKEAIEDLKTITAKERSIDDRALQKKRKRIESVVYGDDSGGTSGRFAVFSGADFVELDQAYDPTYGLMLNRSKVKVQDTKASSTKP